MSQAKGMTRTEVLGIPWVQSRKVRRPKYDDQRDGTRVNGRLKDTLRM